MLGRNSSRPQITPVLEERSANPKSDGGRLLTIAGAARESRPAHEVEGPFAVTRQR